MNMLEILKKNSAARRKRRYCQRHAQDGSLCENDVIHKVKIGSCCLSAFTARRYAGVVYAIVVCLCLSVCPSVCHKRAGIISARLDRVTLQQFVTYATLLHGLLLLLLLLLLVQLHWRLSTWYVLDVGHLITERVRRLEHNDCRQALVQPRGRHDDVIGCRTT